MAHDDLLTIEEIARHLRTSRWSVPRAMAADGVPLIRVKGMGRDGAKRVRLADYLAFLDRRTVPPPKDKAMTEPLPAKPPTMIPFDEVATQYGWSMRKLVDHVRTKGLQHVHVGRQRYFRPHQMEAFIASHTVAARPPDDGLDAVRERLARQRRRPTTQSPAPRRRTAA